MDVLAQIIPTVIERTGAGERGFDLFSRLLKERIVFVTGTVDDSMSTLICAQLLFLESESTEKEIYMYINSPGGSVTAGLAMYDTMQYIKAPVATICMGQACSMGSFLLGAGTQGKRYCLPNARVMIHQPSGGFRGQAADIEIYANEILSLRSRLNDLYVKHTGRTLAEIEKAMERDNFMNAEEAVKFGLADAVLEKRQ